MTNYLFNRYQKIAFYCGAAGAILILFPAGGMFLTPDNTAPWMVAIVAGVVALAISGTLHKIGTGRDRQD